MSDAGAVAVVGEHLDEHGDAAGRVALVGDRLVDDALELAGAPLDGPLDGVERHRRVAGLLVHRAQRRVRVEVAAALAGRHLDLADQLGEELAARLVLRTLLVLDRRPLGMTGHRLRPPAGSSSWRRRSSDSSGWNAATMTGPWRHSTGWPSTVAQHLDAVADPLDDGARMNTAWNGRRRARRRRGRPRTSRPGGRSALRRTAMSIAPKLRWSARPSSTSRRQQDHPRAGAERRHAVARGARPAARTARTTRAASTSWSTRRPACTSASTPARSAGVRDLDAARRRASAQHVACAANAPCSARTPTFTWRPPRPSTAR